MKSGCRRGDGASLLRENSLIARSVILIGWAADIRRQRHGTAGIKIDIFVQRDNALTLRCDRFDPQGDIVDLCRCANAHFPSRFDQTFPTRRTEAFEKQKLNHSIVRESPSWKNTRVV